MCEHVNIIQVNHGLFFMKAFFVDRAMFCRYNDVTSVYFYQL